MSGLPTEIYECPECGLHYKDVNTAKACEDFCREHKACNMDITKLSLEANGKSLCKSV